jgi:hypothetical protein
LEPVLVARFAQGEMSKVRRCFITNELSLIMHPGVVKYAADEATRHKALDFFKRE